MKHKDIIKKINNKIKDVKKSPWLNFYSDLVDDFPQANVYVVGGWVRDIIMGREPKDIDLVVNKIDFSDLVDVLLRHGRVIFDLNSKADLATMSAKERNDILKLGFGVLKYNPQGEKGTIDIALPRVDAHQNSDFPVEGIKRDVNIQSDAMMDIEEDLGRRDFTVNAIAYELKSGELVDHYEGVSDILNKKLKSIGDPEQRIIKEDLSRAFRALRFMVQLDFDIEDRTRDAVEKAFQMSSQDVLEIYAEESKEVMDELICREKNVRDNFVISIDENLPRVLQLYYDEKSGSAKTVVAPEIIAEELFKSFEADILKSLLIWEQAGALNIILPELVRLHGTQEPSKTHSEGDVYDHTILAVKKMLEHEKDPSLELKLAILFHDIGKPACVDYQTNDDDGIKFIEHNKESAKIAQKIFKRLNVGKKFSRKIIWAIENHLLASRAMENGISKVELEKYFFEDVERGELLLKLTKYNDMATIPEGEKKSALEIYGFLKQEVDNLAKLKDAQGKLPPHLIDGNDLIELGVKNGPKFAELIEQIRDLQLNGKITNKTEAIVEIKKLIGLTKK